ncbi:MAG: acetylglutamate kinase [Myxococcota bacterium]|nr:acetylglutamate kinase [Myxococcota bacterium]
MPTTQAEGLWVCKLGGAALQDAAKAEDLYQRLAAHHAAGRQLVVVHGGGPAVSAMAKRLGVASSFHDGLRVTSPALMEVAQMVQLGQVGRGVVTGLARLGVPALSLSGADFAGMLRARLHPERALGRVGEIDAVDVDRLTALTAAGVVPVIAPIGVDEDMLPLNVNADSVAQAVAAALQAERLIFVSDVQAVLGPEGPVEVLRAAQARDWLKDGTIHGGMVPKIRGALDALDLGVGQVAIGNTRICP